MIATYKELGAAASGIGTCGVLLSGIFWAFFSSILVNPNKSDPIDGYYTEEVTKNLPKLYFFMSIYGFII